MSRTNGPSGSRVLSDLIPLFPRMKVVRERIVRVYNDYPTYQDSKLTYIKNENCVTKRVALDDQGS
jgi:hypothetical protein